MARIRDLIPAHMRDLKAGSGSKSADDAGQDAKAGRIAFFTAVEHELHTEADAEKRSVGQYEGTNGLIHAAVRQVMHCVGHGTDTWEDQPVKAGDPVGIGYDFSWIAEKGQRFGNTAEVTHPVVDYANRWYCAIIAVHQAGSVWAYQGQASAALVIVRPVIRS